MKTIYKFLSATVALSVLIAAFMAYFMRSVSEGQVFDGLGRPLSEPPLWAKFFLTGESSWAGFGWHVIDIIWFFGGIAIAYWLYSLSEYPNNK